MASKNINYYISRAMKRQKYIQEKQLAAALGVGTSALSGWKKGRTYPQDEYMVKLAELAGIDPKIGIVDVEIWRAEKKPHTKVLMEMRSILQSAAAVITLAMTFTLMEPSEAPNPA